ASLGQCLISSLHLESQVFSQSLISCVLSGVQNLNGQAGIGHIVRGPLVGIKRNQSLSDVNGPLDVRGEASVEHDGIVQVLNRSMDAVVRAPDAAVKPDGVQDVLIVIGEEDHTGVVQNLVIVLNLVSAVLIGIGIGILRPSDYVDRDLLGVEAQVAG